MVEYIRHVWEGVDLLQLAGLMRSVYKYEGRGDYSIEQFENHLRTLNERFPLEMTFLAFQDGNLIGWTGVERRTDTIGEISRWHPCVDNHTERDEIAKSLIAEVMNYAHENRMNRLEISFGDISDQNIKAYDKHCSWLHSLGWKLVEDTFYMDKDTFEEIPVINIPDGFRLRQLLDIDDDLLYRCHYASFTTSEAREFYGLTESERKQHFKKLYDRSQSINEEASLVLETGGEIVTILLVISRENEAYISVVAVHPRFRKKGLAKALLTTGIQKIRESRVPRISIGVDVVNTPAVNLYKKYGFTIRSRLSFHAWSNAGI